jgi:hypothetical protein
MHTSLNGQKLFHIASLFTPLIDLTHALKAPFSTVSISAEVKLLDNLAGSHHDVFTPDEA